MRAPPRRARRRAIACGVHRRGDACVALCGIPKNAGDAGVAPIHERLFASTKKPSPAENCSAFVPGQTLLSSVHRSRPATRAAIYPFVPDPLRRRERTSSHPVRVGPLTMRPEAAGLAGGGGQGAIGPDAPPDEKVAVSASSQAAVVVVQSFQPLADSDAPVAVR